MWFLLAANEHSCLKCAKVSLAMRNCSNLGQRVEVARLVAPDRRLPRRNAVKAGAKCSRTRVSPVPLVVRALACLTGYRPAMASSPTLACVHFQNPLKIKASQAQSRLIKVKRIIWPQPASGVSRPSTVRLVLSLPLVRRRQWPTSVKASQAWSSLTPIKPSAGQIQAQEKIPQKLPKKRES